MDKTYFMFLSNDELSEYQRVMVNSTLMRKKASDFLKEERTWHLELSQVEFCLILLHVRKNAPKSSLLSRLFVLGQLQDSSFLDILSEIQQNSVRFQIHEH